ncbi:MAG: hypothetical protein ACREQY_22625 [Candidatus Binatia bacterium]
MASSGVSPAFLLPRTQAGRHQVGLVALAIALASLTTFRLYATDEIQYFAHLRSIVFDQDLDFENEYRWFVERDPKEYASFRGGYLERTTPTGLRPNNAPIGSAVLWAPFYLTAVAIERASGEPPGGEAPGFSQGAVAAVCLGSVFWGTVGLLLAHAIARRFADAGAALSATLLVWSGTNLLFYLYVSPPLAHATSFFAVSLLLWWWVERSPEGERPFVLGLLAGLAASVRWQDGIFLSAPLGAPWLAGRARAGPWLRSTAWSAAGALLAFAPQLLVWIHLNGSLWPYADISLGSRVAPLAPRVLDVFFSSFHGLFVWSPVLAPALAGLVMLAARDARGRALLLAVALQLALLSIYSRAFAHGFGQRLFVSSLPAAIVGLAVFGSRVRRPASRRLALAAGILGVWWSLSLMVQYGTGMIPRDRGVPLRVLLENQLVRVPARLPDVLFRYLFARRSLYRVDPHAPPAEDRP